MGVVGCEWRGGGRVGLGGNRGMWWGLLCSKNMLTKNTETLVFPNFTNKLRLRSTKTQILN